MKAQRRFIFLKQVIPINKSNTNDSNTSDDIH